MNDTEHTGDWAFRLKTILVDNYLLDNFANEKNGDRLYEMLSELVSTVEAAAYQRGREDMKRRVLDAIEKNAYYIKVDGEMVKVVSTHVVINSL